LIDGNTKTIDTHYSHDGTYDFNILSFTQTTLEHRLIPALAQPVLIPGDAMYNFNGYIIEVASNVVRFLYRIWRELIAEFFTGAAMCSQAYFPSNGDSLLGSPPTSCMGQALPESLMGIGKILPYLILVGAIGNAHILAPATLATLRWFTI